MNKIITSLFIYGLLFGSGPCLASCGPVLISYISGTKKGIFKGIFTYILFSLARLSIYLILGLGVFFLGKLGIEKLLGGLSKYIFIFGGAFIIIIGMLIFSGNRLEFRFCSLLQDKFLKRDKKSIIMLGIIIGLLPCAPLIAVLSYVGLVSKSWLHSLLYSLSFGLGTFVSPLILLTGLSGLLGHWMQDKKYYQIFSCISGLVIIFLGFQLIVRSF